MTTPVTYWIAAVLTGLYGVVSLTGGIIGYVRADSVPSLVAGSIAGVLLLLCAAGIFYLPAVSLGGAIIIAIALLGRFVPMLIQQRDQLGELLGTVKGIVELVMVIDGVVVIIAAVVALATRGTPPSAP